MFETKTIKQCKLCGEEGLIANSLAICSKCIKTQKKKAEKYILKAHKSARDKFHLPKEPPSDGLFTCTLCNHNCSISEKQKSFCGLRAVEDSKLHSLTTSSKGILNHYLDPLPCNCCAAWFCPAGTDVGFPDYSTKEGPEFGFYNLSVFFYGCSFNCLYCQNYHHKNVQPSNQINNSKLVDLFESNSKITCVCFFGGSPEPHFPFSLDLSQKIIKIAKEQKRIGRICWEWNGFGHKKYIEKAANFSLQTGGNIKFDLKAFNPKIHKALTGIDNTHVLENFRYVGETFFDQRPALPLLCATTLLVPGYIDFEEIEKIAKFIASIDENIPYSILGFHPQFEFYDLGFTSAKFAQECYSIASKYLKRVNIGNKHILR